MPHVKETTVVPHSCQQMFELVNAVEVYPEFIPFCTQSRVLMRTVDTVEAELFFSGGGFHQSFATHNQLLPYQKIEVSLVHGPFKSLSGFWNFEEVVLGQEQGCRVVLDLKFEFSSRWMAMMAGPFFSQIATKLVEVFSKRADELYGKAKR